MKKPLLTFTPNGKPNATITIISSGYYDIDSHALDMLNAGRSDEEINKYIADELSQRPAVEKKNGGFISEYTGGVITIKPEHYVKFYVSDDPKNNDSEL